MISPKRFHSFEIETGFRTSPDPNSDFEFELAYGRKPQFAQASPDGVSIVVSVFGNGLRDSVSFVE